MIIDQLPNGAPFSASDEVAIEKGQTTYKGTLAQLLAALSPIPVGSGGTEATTANRALQNLGVTIPDGWTLEFGYSGGAFNLDFVVSGSERYRLTWWSEGISYQALINGEWQTIWVR